MDLLEYQAKELFREVGIPVLPSQRVEKLEDLKDLEVPFPIVLKSQVYASRRGKAGGIKFAENTIDAIAAAQSILHLSILGQYPRVLLAESKFDSDQELFLAITLDRSARRPILLGSAQGGMSVSSDRVQYVTVDQEFSLFYARRLVIRMGLPSRLLQPVSDVIERMYRLFVTKDLDLIEINPLAVDPSGQLMALDGKVIANDTALGRHPELAALHTDSPIAPNCNTLTQNCSEMGLLDLGGNAAIACNGAGLLMSTMDLVSQAGGKLGCCMNLGGGDYPFSSVDLESRKAQLDAVFATLESSTKHQALLFNLIGDESWVTLLMDSLSERSSQLAQSNLEVILRWAGNSDINLDDTAPNCKFHRAGTLDQAVQETLRTTQPELYRKQNGTSRQNGHRKPAS